MIIFLEPEFTKLKEFLVEKNLSVYILKECSYPSTRDNNHYDDILVTTFEKEIQTEKIYIFLLYIYIYIIANIFS